MSPFYEVPASAFTQYSVRVLTVVRSLRFSIKECIMNSFKQCGIVVFSVLTASTVFAQTTVNDSTAPAGPVSPSTSPSSNGAPDSLSSPAGTNGSAGQHANDLNSYPATPATTGTGSRTYNPSGMVQPDTSTSSGTSGTVGGYSSGSGQMGNGASGARSNVNDPHVTPQPGSADYGLYRGN